MTADTAEVTQAGDTLPSERIEAGEVAGLVRVTLADFEPGRREELIREHAIWVSTVVNESMRLETLTPRMEQEVLNILNAGFGDILFLEEAGRLVPVSILLLTETIAVGDQVKLKKHIDATNPYVRLTSARIFESTLGYTVPECRGQGHNGYLRSRLYANVQYRNGVIVGSTCNPVAMIMLARNGLVPVSHEEFPLATTLLSFAPFPTVFKGVKPVPPIECVSWASSDEVMQLRELLADRLVRRGNSSIEDYPRKPVVFISMRGRQRFLAYASSRVAYLKAFPHGCINEIEVGLQLAIRNSERYQGLYRGNGIGNKEILLHLALQELSNQLMIDRNL
ncbi:hypothetical protein JW766_01210 [Candidatus Dojkabacteria bacterium]|nr:hypothetical protein [Candidatus Dojkabacteria bacterium]